LKVRDFTCFRDPAEDLVRGTVARTQLTVSSPSSPPPKRVFSFDFERKKCVCCVDDFLSFAGL